MPPISTDSVITVGRRFLHRYPRWYRGWPTRFSPIAKAGCGSVAREELVQATVTPVRSIVPDASIGDRNIYGVAQDSAGRIWATTWANPLLWEGGRLTQLAGRPWWPPLWVTTIEPDTDGRIDCQRAAKCFQGVAVSRLRTDSRGGDTQRCSSRSSRDALDREPGRIDTPARKRVGDGHRPAFERREGPARVTRRCTLDRHVWRAGPMGGWAPADVDERSRFVRQQHPSPS